MRESTLTPTPTQAVVVRYALEALGDLAGAADRRCFRDALAAWRRLCTMAGHADLVAGGALPAPIWPLTIEAQGPTIAHAWSELMLLVLAAVRNVNAVDADRHWKAAAEAFTQTAANAANHAGVNVAWAIRQHEIHNWTEAAGDLDHDPPVAQSTVDRLVGLAETAGHYGRFVLGTAEER